jgi:broad-specificity NMP kinase
MKLTKKNQLFIVTGASGVGKSSACEVLLQKETRYIVMESDLLWSSYYDKPENDYHEYRELWLNVCANISQIGMPVVLCGCATPDQFEKCKGRDYFTEIICIAVVTDKSELEKRMREGRNITDENWIEGSCNFNRWLMEHAEKTTPNMILVDSTNKSIELVATEIDAVIVKYKKE